MFEEPSNFVVPDGCVIEDEHLVAVCKYRQSGCCKYIVFFDNVNEFCCVKNIPELRKQIDMQSPEMNAQGDNCKGLMDEKRTKSEGA